MSTGDRPPPPGSQPPPGDPGAQPAPGQPQQPQQPPPAAGPPSAPPQQGQYPAPPQQAPPGQGYPIKRSVVRVLGFSILSFGLYSFYWFYVTRDELRRELRSEDNPGLQTAGLLVPILNFVIIYWLWRDINAARRWVGLPEFSIPLYLILSILGLSPIFYSLVVMKLNEYWDRRTGGYAVDAPITGAEKAVVAVGALMWVLYLLVIVLVIVLAASSGSSSSSF